MKTHQRGGHRKGSGRKPTGRTKKPVRIPITLIAIAREEKARRHPQKSSIGGIVTEWAEAGRKMP